MLTCSKCGLDLPPGFPEGSCPGCILSFAVEDSGTILCHEDGEPGARLTVGRTFGDYELLEEIARGGMGIVYKARQISLGRVVAVKMIVSGVAASREVIHRFRTEAAAAANLQHPNIVAVHEVGAHQGENFLVMDFVDGPNLSRFVGQQPLPARKAARYVKVIAEAIHYAHERGILHRDLKPSNILIDSTTDQPRVTDFGLAKRLDSESSLTVSGQILGSPSFMSPEQAGGNRSKVGRCSDVYGLGGVLYHLLTARVPFQAETLEAIIAQVIGTEPVSPRLLNPNVPRDLETICLKCLEKEPDKRYITAQELVDELDRFLGDQPIQARPVTRFEQAWRWCRRRPAFAASFLATLLLLLVVLVGSPIAVYRINEARKAEFGERQRAEKEASARREQLYAAEVNLAQEALADGNLGRAQQLLNRQRPFRGEANDLRGFEWRYIHGQCGTDEMVNLGESSRPFTAVCFVPDRDWLAATDGDGNVKLWDYRTFKEIFTFPAYTNIVRSGSYNERKALAVSAKGAALAVGVGSSIALWDLNTRLQTAVLKNSTNTLCLLAFSSDDQTLASAAQDGTTTIWDVAVYPPKPAAVLTNRLPTVSLAYSNDGKLLAIGGQESVVRLWDVSNLAAPHELHPLKGFTSWTGALGWSPGTSRLACGSGSQITLWDVVAQGACTEIGRMKDTRAPLGIIDSLSFSPDGRMLASAGSDRNVTLWDLSGIGRQPLKLKGHEGEILSTAFSPNGQRLASSGLDGRVKLWDVSTPWRVAPRMSHGDWLYAVAFSPDSRLLASSAQHDKLKLWDVATEQLLAEIGIVPNSLIFSTSGKLLVTASSETIHLLEVPSLAEITNFPGNSPALSWDGSELIYFHMGSLHRRNLQTQAVHVGNPVWESAGRKLLSPNHKIIAVTGGDGTAELRQVRLHNVDAADRFVELGWHADQVAGLAFSPNGQWLASASWDGTNRVWDLKDSHRRGISLAAHNGPVWAVAFSPDGRTLATGGDDNTIRLWHLASFQQAAALKGHQASVTALSFSPDGKHLASGSGDGTVRIWRAPSFEEIESGEGLK